MNSTSVIVVFAKGQNGAEYSAPPELFTEYLLRKELMVLETVNKNWKNAIQDDYQWK